MSKQLEFYQSVIDICSETAVDAIGEGLTKAELVSQCFNQELGAYGIITQVSPDKSVIFLDDNGMSKVLDYFKGTGYQPVLTAEHTNRIQKALNYANQNNIQIIWKQVGLQKCYYQFKQYGFSGIQLFNVLKVNTVNNGLAAVAANGAAPLSLGTIVALSWTGGMFFGTVEKVIPDHWVKTKVATKTAKFVLSFPVSVIEWTANGIFGAGEAIFLGKTLPINVTKVQGLADGPNVTEVNLVLDTFKEWAKNKFGK